MNGLANTVMDPGLGGSGTALAAGGTTACDAPMQRLADVHLGVAALLERSPEQWASMAQQALGQWLAAVDRRQSRVVWRSEALAERFRQWQVGVTVPELEVDFKGITELLATEGPGRRYSIVGPQQMPLGVKVVCAGEGISFLSFEDIGERQRAVVRHLSDREQLLFISRSMSVGEMASTLAHELNQPIGAMTNLMRGLLNRLERGELEHESARNAISRGIDQALYAAGIITRIREFVAARQPQQESIDLHRLVQRSLDLLDWEITRDQVRIEKRLSAERMPLHGDPVMLQQVLVNLVRNAVDAMRLVNVRERRLALETRVEDGMVLLDVKDLGTGMTEAVAERLFTPFFSTKPGSMGVGLNICRSIIELHQGRLWFTQDADRGCTFHIALPIVPV